MGLSNILKNQLSMNNNFPSQSKYHEDHDKTDQFNGQQISRDGN